MPRVVATASVNPPAGRPHDSAAWRWVVLAVLCLFLANVWRTEADADLWGHLRFGLDSLSNGRLADRDPYSYTAAGARWTNHEWLAELTFAGCYRFAGVSGLIALRAVLLAATFAALGLLVRRRGPSPAATLALALFTVTFLPEFYRIRPQMFTYTAFAWLIVACDAHRAGQRGRLALLPALFALWCNFHAGFVAGLGVFGIYCCDFAYEARRLPQRRREWSFLVLVLAGCVAATLCNPYGVEYWRYVLFAVTMPRPAITEWGPVWTHHPVVLGCYLTAVVVPALCWLRSSRSGAIAETAAFVLVAYLAARHGRHLPFAILLGSAVFCRRWPEFVRRLSLPPGNGPERQSSLSAGLAPDRPVPRWGLALLVVAALLGGATKLTREVSASQREGLLTVPTDLYPVAAVSFLAEQRLDGNLFCGFSWGEYCLWHLAPRCRVFCDGRYETVYPAEVSRLALSRAATPRDCTAIIDDYPTEIVLTPAAGPLAGRLAARGDFVEVYRDNLARIFVRRNARFADWLKAPGRLRPAPAPHAAQVAFPG